MTNDSSIASVAESVKLLEETIIEAVKSLNSKLDQIHVLVNSNLTAANLAKLSANQSELSALESSVRLAKEIIGLKRATGVEPSEEIFKEIDDTQQKIEDLRTLITKQTSSIKGA